MAMISNEKPLKAVIESMLEAYQLKAKINEVRIINEWEKAVGPIVSQSTEKLYVRKGKLYVYLSSSVIKNELVFARQQIIKRLNDAIGEEVITELIVK
jgi:hypothetical protein